MNQDFSELIEYLDKKFGQTASKENIQTLQAEVDQKFTRTFEVFATNDELKQLNNKTERIEESIRALTNAVDRLVKAVDDLRVEYSSTTMQLSRHEKWIQQLAGKLGVKLEY